MRFVPTSITVAPGLTNLGGDQPRRADRRDEDVGARADRGEVAGARVADGHRRVRAEQQLASGRPTRIERPTIDRLGALDLDARVAQQLDHAAAACTGRAPGAPGRAGRRSPRSSPSTSLAGSIAAITASWSICSGSGSWTRIPSTVVVLVELRRSARAARPSGSRRRARGGTSASRPPRSGGACWRRRSCEAGSSPTSTVASPGTSPPRSAPNSRTPAATRSRTSAATALPSMIVALTRSLTRPS